VQSVINSGVVPRLVALLQHPSKMVVASALRAVGNILLGDDTQAQCVINNGGLPALLQLLLHDYEPLRRDACRAVSNITAGNADQIQAVMEAGIFPVLIALMHTPNSVGVDSEAGWALINVANRGRPEQLAALKELGCDTRIFTLEHPTPARRHGPGAGALMSLVRPFPPSLNVNVASSASLPAPIPSSPASMASLPASTSSSAGSSDVAMMDVEEDVEDEENASVVVDEEEEQGPAAAASDDDEANAEEVDEEIEGQADNAMDNLD